MLSATAAAFNKAPTLSNLVQLAQQSPAEARGAIATVAKGLKGVPLPAEMKSQLDTILAAQDVQLSQLVQNSTLFKSIFPDGAYADFATCVQQATRPESIGWAATEAPPQVPVTGVVKHDTTSGAYVMTTAGGRQFNLVGSDRMSKIQPNMSAGWMEGFLGDGDQPLTVLGTLSADGKSVRVEGYCPGTSSDFVFGRAKIVHPMTGPIERLGQPPTKAERDEVLQGGRVYVMTSRGEVEVTNPEFRNLLVHVPRLGVIIPVKPTELPDGKLVIDTNPDFFYALGGRFQSSPTAPATDLGNGVWQTSGNFAYDNFKGPVQCEGDAAKWRMENNAGQRNWLGGTFVLNAAGEVDHFAAKYLSTDLAEYQLGTNATDGNALQSLLAGSEVTDGGAQGVVRQMGAPPAPAAAAPATAA